MNKLEICKRTRKIASDSLRLILEKVLRSNKPISEASFGNLWLKELRKHKEIFPNGWYDPPPHGIIILFASDKNLRRLNFKSVRGEEWWPKKDIFMDRKSGLLLFYASPVDKKTGIIGDFQLTIYLGKNPKIIKLLKKNLNISKKLVNKISPKMKFKDITDIASGLLKKEGLINAIYSASDPANFNIGHTIPFSNEPMNELEMKILEKGSWNKVLAMISEKRVF